MTQDGDFIQTDNNISAILIILFPMWNTAAASKIIESRSQDKHYQIHKQKLKKMKPMMIIKQPQQPSFVYANHKLQMSRRDRLIEINKQNDILVRKMSKINDAQHPQDKLRSESQWLKTLNQQVSTTLKQKIDYENKRICDKLMRVHSYYPTTQIIQETSQLTRTMLNISENARRFRSLSKSDLRRPNSAVYSSTSRFVRSGVMREHQQNEKENKVNGWKEQQEKGDWTQKRLIRPGSAPSIKIGNREILQQKKRLGIQRMKQSDYEQL